MSDPEKQVGQQIENRGIKDLHKQILFFFEKANRKQKDSFFT